MAERPEVRDLIERIVRQSGLPDERARADLRRELASHFEDCGTSEDAVRAALERFGAADEIATGFRSAQRARRPVLYTLKVALSILCSLVVVLLVMVPANLRTHGAARLHIGPMYFFGVGVSLLVVLLLVVAWEFDIEPLCVRAERRPVRMALLLVVFFCGALLVHMHGDSRIGALGAAVASLTTVTIWVATVAILARMDLFYLRLFQPRS